MQTNEQLLLRNRKLPGPDRVPGRTRTSSTPRSAIRSAGGGKRLRPMLLMLALRHFHRPVSGRRCRLRPPSRCSTTSRCCTTTSWTTPPCAAANLRSMPSGGQSVAILSGDAMMICAYRLLSERARPTCCRRMLGTFNTMALEVCEGQQYDMDFEQQTQGLGRRIHAHDRAQDLGAAGRLGRHRRHAGRRLGRRTAANCGVSPSSWGWLSSFRTTCWTATATTGWAKPSAATSSKASRPT